MTKAKHTPGPWEVEYKVNVKSSKGDFVASCGCNGRDIDVSISNARLIAAAPEMLELLEDLIDMEGPQPGCASWAEKVQAVIKKATGGK